MDDKNEIVDMDEDLQNEVGVLWDMTINMVRHLKIYDINKIKDCKDAFKCPYCIEF